MSAPAEHVPEWLAAWRARGAAPVPARPLPAAAPAAAPRPARVGRKPGPLGFHEPAPWPFDGCARREPVLDTDHNPPRVGWCRCLRCRKQFFSDDVIGIRLCVGCRG